MDVSKLHKFKLKPDPEDWIVSVDVVAGTRPLRVTWNPTMVQDIRAFHNIDAEAELAALLSRELAAEFDRAIVNTIRGMQHIDVNLVIVRRMLKGACSLPSFSIN